MTVVLTIGAIALTLAIIAAIVGAIIVGRHTSPLDTTQDTYKEEHNHDDNISTR